MVRAARPDSPSSRRTTFAPRRGRRWAWMNPKTSAVVTTVGSLPTMAKNTLRSNATANKLLIRSLAPAKARYSSTRGWPSVMATISWPSATRFRTGLQRIEDSREHAGARATARRRARGISPTYWEVKALEAGGVEGVESGADSHRLAHSDVPDQAADAALLKAEVDAGHGLLQAGTHEELVGGDRLREGGAGEVEVAEPGQRAHGRSSWLRVAGR